MVKNDFFRVILVHLPGISFPPQLQSGNRQTSLRHLAAVLSGCGCGYIGSGLLAGCLYMSTNSAAFETMDVDGFSVGLERLKKIL